MEARCTSGLDRPAAARTVQHRKAVHLDDGAMLCSFRGAIRPCSRERNGTQRGAVTHVVILFAI